MAIFGFLGELCANKTDGGAATMRISLKPNFEHVDERFSPTFE